MGQQRAASAGRRPARRWWAVAIGALLLLPHAAWASDTPPPDPPAVPCPAMQQEPFPTFADPPNLEAWTRKDLPTYWPLPPCVHWGSKKIDTLVALAGVFSFPGGADDILRRFAAISGWRGTQYWSAGDGRSEPFILAQSAVVSDSDDRPRPDFTLAELKSRRPLYFQQQDNRSTSTVTYRMRLEDAGADRFVVTIENVSTMWLILPILGPGDIRVTYIVQNIGPGRWGYYSLTGVSGSRGHADSVTSRAVALYRHVSGLDLLQQAAPPPQ